MKDTASKQATSKVWIPWSLLGLVLFCLALLWWKREEVLPMLCQSMIEDRLGECQKQLATLRAQLDQRHREIQGPSEAERQWADITGAAPRWPEDIFAPQDCDAVQEDLLSICWALDSKAYIRARGPAGGSFALLEKAVEDLASHTPVVSGEALTPEAVLANAFHLFRVLGSSRTELLRDILVLEEGLVEPGAMALYRWLITREQCAGDAAVIPFRVLYDYSAYLLNTLGGQGYLRRRSPKLSGLSMFYALMVLNEGLKRGIDPYGIDIRPHIAICRDLLRSQELVFRDHYMSVLQEMERTLGQ